MGFVCNAFLFSFFYSVCRCGVFKGIVFRFSSFRMVPFPSRSSAGCYYVVSFAVSSLLQTVRSLVVQLVRHVDNGHTLCWVRKAQKGQKSRTKKHKSPQRAFSVFVFFAKFPYIFFTYFFVSSNRYSTGVWITLQALKSNN